MRLLLFALLLLTLGIASAQGDDGIPDNCEALYAEFYRPNLFPRYQPASGRLILVDWTTGDEVAQLDSGLPPVIMRGWSGSCRYLAVASGSADSRATIVYDTVTMRRVGQVEDAHRVPHPLTWGPDDFLVVESRLGPVIWNVPANLQYRFPDIPINAISVRNFSRLRWDVENRLLIANLAVGGRVVIDLSTGALTTLPNVSTDPRTVILGGEQFPCELVRASYTAGSTVPGVFIRRDADSGVVYVGRRIGPSQRESLETLGVVETLDLRERGWSHHCRYVGITVRVPQTRNYYDTLIFDLQEDRLVGTFEDAVYARHPLYWDTAEENVLIQTLDGAFLWNLATGRRTLINDQVDSVMENNYTARSFHAFGWDANRRQFLGVPIQSPDTIVAYSVDTGAEVARYPFAEATRPLELIVSNDGRYLVGWAGGRAQIWDRDSGAVARVELGQAGREGFRAHADISPNNRWLAVHRSSVRLWDLTQLATHMPVTATFAYRLGSRVFFNTSTELIGIDQTVRRRLNIETGAFDSGVFTLVQQPPTYNGIGGLSGYTVSATLDPFTSHQRCNIFLEYNSATREVTARDLNTQQRRVIASDVNTARQLFMSPDCRYAYGYLQQLNADLTYDETPGSADAFYPLDNQLIIWDYASGTPVVTVSDPYYNARRNFSNPRSSYSTRDEPTTWWSPAGERAILQTGGGYFIASLQDGAALPIQFMDGSAGLIPRNASIYWFYERGVLLIGGSREVFVVEMLTGQEVARLSQPIGGRNDCGFSGWVGCGIEVTADGRWIFVYGRGMITAWDLDTLGAISVPEQTPGNWVSASDGGALGFAAVSPDRRYLVLARTVIQVWDTQTLPSNINQRRPITFIDGGGLRMRSVQFIDATTLEVTAESDGQLITTRYNVVTGEEV